VLVELLVALAVMGVIGGVQVAIMSAGFDAWNHSHAHLLLQQVGEAMMEQLLEGGPDEEGLKDAVELRAAELTSISIVPLWTDRSHAAE